MGFPLHPFVRVMIFYYGLDFHHMAPNSILHLASIMVCETFLCCEPHFDLWLKTFGVKPKSSDSNLVECGWGHGQ
jgi:hypothetical protein